MSLSIDEKLEYLMKQAKLQGSVGLLQIEEIAENSDEENILREKLQKNDVEINIFLKQDGYGYKTAHYQIKNKNSFLLTTRIDENGNSLILTRKKEKELFEKMILARNEILKFAFENSEIRDFIVKIAEKVSSGTIRITAVKNCEKNADDELLNAHKNNFLRYVEKIKASRNPSAKMFFELDFNEKTKGIIYNKFSRGKEFAKLIQTSINEAESRYCSAKHEIIEANIRLVFSVAKEYSYSHRGILDISDIIQEGNIGLIDAVESFNYKQAIKFSSWAVWYIKKQIWTAVNSFKKSVHVPPKISAQLQKISHFEDKCKMQKGANPSLSEIAEELGVKEKQILALLSSDFNDDDNHIELNQKMQHFDTLQEAIERSSDPFSILEMNDLKENIDKMLAEINEREREIIKLYFGLSDGNENMSMAQIGNIYGLSRERVRQIIDNVLEQIKKRRNTLIKEYR